MDALDKVLGDAIRVFAANKGPTPQFLDLLKAVYDEPAYEMAVTTYGRLAAQYATGATPVRDNPGDPVTRVQTIIDWTSTCIAFYADRNFAAVFPKPLPPGSTDAVLQLKPMRPDRDLGHHNPTRWSITADGERSATHVQEMPCH
jgi:hypothetical protein